MPKANKQCLVCLIYFEATLENFYKHNTNKDGLYPYCKECAKFKTKKWQSENYDYFLEETKKSAQRRRVNPEIAQYHRNKSNEQRMTGYHREWQRNNKDKVKFYQQQRWSSKKHNISENEWKRCKEYFDYCCAYCGMSEQDHKEKFKQQLHKEHVIHEGRNDIKNCVTSCKQCNGSKHTKSLNQWFNTDNPNYTRERYLRIYQWLRYDCKN